MGRDNEDRIQPRNHPTTDKIEVADPWLTIGPDEITIREESTDSERPSYAEIIRLMTASYHRRKVS